MISLFSLSCSFFLLPRCWGVVPRKSRFARDQGELFVLFMLSYSGLGPIVLLLWLNAQRGRRGKSPELVATFARCHAGRRLGAAARGTALTACTSTSSARVAEAWRV
ncbi:hypothetical protein GGI35DRAFT_450963 [Trichoderma velutinum]